MTRRAFTAGAAALATAPCACLAGTPGQCCKLPDAAAGAVGFEGGLVRIDLRQTPQLARAGSAIRIMDDGRKLRLLVARPEKNRFVALDQTCTHGGGALTYVHRHRWLHCTCWGHARFALDGTVLYWPNKQQPKPLRAYTAEMRGGVLEIRVDGA
jgi:nitrite reductase/ring-hydroxylating ferredoxin subunit